MSIWKIFNWFKIVSIIIEIGFFKRLSSSILIIIQVNSNIKFLNNSISLNFYFSFLVAEPLLSFFCCMIVEKIISEFSKFLEEILTLDTLLFY